MGDEDLESLHSTPSSPGSAATSRNFRPAQTRDSGASLLVRGMPVFSRGRGPGSTFRTVERSRTYGLARLARLSPECIGTVWALGPASPLRFVWGDYDGDGREWD